MDVWPENYIEVFWQNYPRRIAKKAAVRSLDKVRKSGECTFAQLIEGVRNYALAVQGKDMQYVCHPATWLNQGRWDDDVSAIAGKPAARTTGDVARNLLDKLHAADHMADGTRRSGGGGGADVERVPEFPLLGRIDADAGHGVDAMATGNSNGSRVADSWGAEDVQGISRYRGPTH